MKDEFRVVKDWEPYWYKIQYKKWGLFWTCVSVFRSYASVESEGFKEKMKRELENARRIVNAKKTKGKVIYIEKDVGDKSEE